MDDFGNLYQTPSWMVREVLYGYSANAYGGFAYHEDGWWPGYAVEV